MRILRVIKDYSDVQERNIFIANKPGVSPQIETALVSAVLNASEKICVVLESGLTDAMMQILLSNPRARRYIIVPQIKEEKLKDISGKAIIREVPTVKGNYLIVDEKQLYMFDSQLNGVSIMDNAAVQVVYQTFMHEFWGAEAKFEFIDKKETAAEITFDLPPVYGNESVLLDFSQDNRTKVEDLIAFGNGFYFVDKIGAVQSSSSLILKNIVSNKEFLERTNNETIIYAPALPLSFVSKGQNFFAMNFDIEKYTSLPERQTGRLFAIKVQSDINLGQTFRFVKHKIRKELVGVHALDLGGKSLEVLQSTVEERAIIVDLGLAKEYAKMPQEILESRLNAKYGNVLSSSVKACSVTYNITLNIDKRKMQRKADIYGKYETLNKELNKKALEITAYSEAMKLADLQAEILFNGELTGNIATVNAYESAVAKVNGWADKYRLLVDKNSKIDDSLAEVKGGDKKKPGAPTVISKLIPNSPIMDLPKFGTLYQDGRKYEYLLRSENDFDSAKAEMVSAKISDVTYHLE